VIAGRNASRLISQKIGEIDVKLGESCRCDITARSNHGNNMLTDSEKILLDMAYLDRGLVPNGSTLMNAPSNQLELAFANMSSKDVRKMKRKYRKYLRKAITWRTKIIRDNMMRKNFGRSASSRKEMIEETVDIFLRTLGMGKHNHGKICPGHQFKRRVLVRDYFLRNLAER
jgi:hypothetical protein